MATTSPDAIYSVDASTDFDLVAITAAMAASVQAALTSKLGDTGWVSLTAGSGWTLATVAYRVKAGICYLRGEVYGGADMTTVFTLPSGARPTARFAAPIARYATSSAPVTGMLSVATTGVATIVMSTGSTLPAAAPGLTLGQISFPVN